METRTCGYCGSQVQKYTSHWQNNQHELKNCPGFQKYRSRHQDAI